MLRADGAVTLVAELGLAGIGWWREMLKILRDEFPHREFDTLLDCGPAPGLALAALRAGIDHVAVNTDADTLEKLRAIAAQLGARVAVVPGGTTANPEV